MPVAVCANLPYYITSPIVMKLLGDRLPIESLTVMVQKEAADRLAAAPGTRASSAISCAVSYYATSKMMFTAAPGSFYPAPKVTSAVVRRSAPPPPCRWRTRRATLPLSARPLASGARLRPMPLPAAWGCPRMP